MSRKRILLFFAVIACASLVAGALYREPSTTKRFSGAATPAAMGFIDYPAEELLSGASIEISGWALDPAGVARVDAVLDEQVRSPLGYGIVRDDVAAAHPGLPDSLRAGFEGSISLGQLAPGRHDLVVELTNRRGETKVVGKKTIVLQNQIRKPLTETFPEQRFYILMATSGLMHGGAQEIRKLYGPLESSTVRVGVRIPILYMRTTRGRTGDWVFDPEFDTSRRCGNRIIAEDSLAQVIAYAKEQQLPVLFTLNGGVWADAACDIPDWDINDTLEQNPDYCQWNEAGEVFPDDHLQHLPGSMDGPQLARALTYNVHAKEVRRYKKRNLQQAGQVIREFARQHPHLFAGINLDPDVYTNPFFESPKRWHDYNPQTIQQFREWLQGSGPYAGAGGSSLPDLREYRRSDPLSLAQVNMIAGKNWRDWSEVDPPREFPRLLNPFWESPWVREWERFRRHLIDLHYDELSDWLAEIGIEKRFIFSSQGFLAPQGKSMPFAIYLDSPVKNYDSGGMSIEGSVPRNGHLGAILYGDASLNHVRMEGTASLFATFRTMDPDWSVVEHNTADFRAPETLPGISAGYRSLRDMFNYGARFFSPMAWNGANGTSAGQPGFAAYTALRNTPLEDAIRDFMISHANFPRGGLLWTFGTPVHADGDGWSVSKGSARLGKGSLTLTAENDSQEIALLSPRELGIDLTRLGTLQLVGRGTENITGIEIRGRDERSGKWTILRAMDAIATGQQEPGNLMLEFSEPLKLHIDQLELRMQFPPAILLKIDQIALWPRRQALQELR